MGRAHSVYEENIQIARTINAINMVWINGPIEYSYPGFMHPAFAWPSYRCRVVPHVMPASFMFGWKVIFGFLLKSRENGKWIRLTLSSAIRREAIFDRLALEIVVGIRVAAGLNLLAGWVVATRVTRSGMGASRRAARDREPRHGSGSERQQEQ